MRNFVEMLVIPIAIGVTVALLIPTLAGAFVAVSAALNYMMFLMVRDSGWL